jgi:hypothetical protein
MFLAVLWLIAIPNFICFALISLLFMPSNLLSPILLFYLFLFRLKCRNETKSGSRQVMFNKIMIALISALSVVEQISLSNYVSS